ncbi:Glu/Leu/Phe/Val dehydrogenase dimerization domain-containing protein [Microbacterium trichothecenolyticum]|uniref:Glu/Leu/Phe/Val dehydrogenase dimerization domain-containing protein n=1 Tax=Microbacterium trichothecenolyticum TaxID=69370 RepID=UPI0035BE3E6D
MALSRRQGILNKRHAILAGGIRRHPLEEEEFAVLVDGLNLSRAMSFKNIAAGLDFGGSKTTVQMEPLDVADLEALGFLAFALDRCRTMTGPDMNFPTEMADVINEHFSAQFTNGPSSPLGESGRPTAYGTYLALKEAVRFRESTDSLTGKSAAVMGLGAVGWYLAEHIYSETQDLLVADVDKERVARFLAQHPGAREVAVDEVLGLDVDILAPAAIGGIIDESVIERLRCRYLFGPANNQLNASVDARTLQARGPRTAPYSTRGRTTSASDTSPCSWCSWSSTLTSSRGPSRSRSGSASF